MNSLKLRMQQFKMAILLWQVIMSLFFIERCFMDTLETIKKQITENPVILYMKGSPVEPKCGFSANAVRILQACGIQFEYVDILENPDIRTTLPSYANWPTFPQLYIHGELIGGSDIMSEMYESGELQELLK
jgi:monothiol glutaredoxin